MSKIKIEIKNKFTGKILFEYERENNTVRETVVKAVEDGADLRSADLSGADLRSADLRSADLRSADLRSADLRSADLSGADLSGADLSGADLRSADLRSADLSGADLSGADLRSADLRSADLSGADLSGADLRSADLRSADLSPIKNDMFAVLLTAIPEIPNLKKAILSGKIDGSTYTGDCACLAGTLMKCKIKSVANIVDLQKDGNRPIERFFLAIKPGHTPENNQFAKVAYGWIEEFEGYLNTVSLTA